MQKKRHFFNLQYSVSTVIQMSRFEALEKVFYWAGKGEKSKTSSTLKYIRGKTLVGLSVSKYDINIELLYSFNITMTVSAKENNAYAGNASFKEKIPEKNSLFLNLIYYFALLYTLEPSSAYRGSTK